MRRWLVFFTLAFGCLYIAHPWATTRTAASCTQAAINTQITASSDGDTVVVPAGACTWSGAVIVGSTDTRTKMIKLLGTGTGGVPGAAACSNTSTCTVITASNYSTSVDGQCCPVLDFHLNFDLAGLEVAGFWFIQGPLWVSSTEEEVWGIRLTGNADTTGSQINIHHNHAEYETTTVDTTGCDSPGVNCDDAYGSIINFMRIGGNGSRSTTKDISHVYIFGVIHHNVLHGGGSYQCWDVTPYSGRSFNSPTLGSGLSEGDAGGILASEEPLVDHLGTFKQIYVEDNTLTAGRWQDNNACADGQAGSVQTWRHNTMINEWIGNHGYELDTSAKWLDINNNVIALDETRGVFASPFDSRGGTMVSHHNQYYDGAQKGAYVTTGTETWDDRGELIYYRFDSARGPFGCAGLMSNFSLPLGCDNRTTTTGTQKGYLGGWQPCTKKGNSQPTWAWTYDWANEPCVAWANTYGASIPTTTFSAVGGGPPAAIIEERRDFIDYNSCAGHMGETICSTYWDDVLNQKKDYTQYTYPHPLQGSSGSTTSPRVRLRIKASLETGVVPFLALTLFGGIHAIRRRSAR